LAYGTLLAGDAAWRDRSTPEVVVTVGAVGLSRGVADLVARAGTHVAVDPRPLTHLADPTRSARIVVDQVPQAHPRPAGVWSDRWAAADACAREIATGIDDPGELSGPVVARAVAAAVGAGDLLVIGSSWPIRHVAAYGGALRTRAVANRGTSGIDGVVSMAWGAALAHHRATGGSTVCLLGDLTAVYDRNGLLAAPGEERPPLTYVVIDNDGGGIFSSLEQGDDRFARDFDRVFGTPHGADLAELLAAPGVDVLRVTNRDDVVRALSTPSSWVRIVIAACAPRTRERAVVAAAQERLASALARINDE
jgi:2-succinyl-5-enolpyruvyl-6-hydroxy-3-cyclohexene-1-carboxylate synthase